MLATWVAGALLLGLLARLVGLPPLVGFLGAGFAFSALGFESTPVLEELSHAGVLLLLFAVGLKLRLKTLLRVEIWGTALVHMAVLGVLVYAVIASASPGWKVALALAAALGFSSTVFAAKVLEGIIALGQLTDERLAEADLDFETEVAEGGRRLEAHLSLPAKEMIEWMDERKLLADRVEARCGQNLHPHRSARALRSRDDDHRFRGTMFQRNMKFEVISRSLPSSRRMPALNRISNSKIPPRFVVRRDW